MSIYRDERKEKLSTYRDEKKEKSMNMRIISPKIEGFF